MRDGASPREALDALLAADTGRDDRQAGIVDARGRAATHTGQRCMPWAGGRSGAGYAVQGNILTGPDVVDAMAEAYESSSGDLADRLLLALAAGDAAGGDRRGRQSAAIAIAAPGGGYGGNDDRLVDLRVDDHPDPVTELGPPLRHSRAADRHGARRDQASPRRGALGRGARPARARRAIQAIRVATGSRRRYAISWASRTSRRAGGTRTGSTRSCSSTCAPAPRADKTSATRPGERASQGRRRCRSLRSSGEAR